MPCLGRKVIWRSVSDGATSNYALSLTERYIILRPKHGIREIINNNK